MWTLTWCEYINADENKSNKHTTSKHHTPPAKTNKQTKKQTNKQTLQQTNKQTTEKKKKKTMTPQNKQTNKQTPQGKPNKHPNNPQTNNNKPTQTWGDCYITVKFFTKEINPQLAKSTISL